jgi:hypothetical protein
MRSNTARFAPPRIPCVASPLEDAPNTLSYLGEREVAQRALQYLKAHPELGDHATDTTH